MIDDRVGGMSEEESEKGYYECVYFLYSGEDLLRNGR
jgi:hypothetical protein